MGLLWWQFSSFCSYENGVDLHGLINPVRWSPQVFRIFWVFAWGSISVDMLQSHSHSHSHSHSYLISSLSFSFIHIPHLTRLPTGVRALCMTLHMGLLCSTAPEKIIACWSHLLSAVEVFTIGATNGILTDREDSCTLACSAKSHYCSSCLDP